MKDKEPRSKLAEYPELYRATMNCRIASDALDGRIKCPEGAQKTEYALYCLAHAIEDIALALMKEKSGA